MNFIMVTNFGDHWKDKQTTYYTPSMLKNGLQQNQLKDDTSTLFIKKNKDKVIEGCWLGKVTNISSATRNGKTIIKFTVSIDREVVCPAKFITYSEGWYQENDPVFQAENPQVTTISNQNDPACFDKLHGSCTWEEFEDNTYIC